MLDDKRDVDAFGALLERLETLADRLEEVDGDIARVADALEERNELLNTKEKTDHGQAS